MRRRTRVMQEGARRLLDQHAVCPSRMRGAIHHGSFGRHRSLGLHFADKTGETVNAEAYIQPVRAHVHRLDQQRNDAQLLGGDEVRP
ncbi:hypothetical protein AB9K41_22155 [Cribrihabitans sp. XS_ASV171]